ncbi:NAD(P)-dependent dehydrogenase, short-chain alcohol dehydrogenase family [Myxococcus fulvus]|uniref:3-ketoacyl-ACP reductase n=1 Tax=Myxococcus fulvus TaxID=33 RepID=A0A511TD00_MYXFU|nr:SDR family oxidoreductase [Myxococcus fulvus]AKF86732.1 hypothetical protein MFUL124B02_31985 [Myxococcus fulvus 124B02]GEN11018.1 3-ketoacyl-ACP reductase [Myxococcus fulvus]SET39761.1 NAD(P)-dependent dehydrogenase, short-chain alcohol dehydrogenase family [Myxococcus fulvus]
MSAASTPRVALVTGASAGLGRAIASRLGEEGWTVGLVARRRERLEVLAGELRALGAQAHVLAGDLRDSRFAQQAVDTLVRFTGRLDLLVNNAGAPTSSREPVATDAELDAAFALNVRAAYRLSQLALPHLRATRGCVVNIGSAGVARTVPLDLMYLVSKGAVETLSRGLAKTWAPLGVRVNTVSPGLVETEILQATGMSREDGHAHFLQARAAMQPLPHEGQPGDVAHAVSFLASPQAAFITGATLHVDGGMSLGG